MTRRLSDIGSGRPVVVAGIEGDESFRSRLIALGIFPGVELAVVRAGRGQPVVVGVRGGRLMIDPHSSDRITVHEPHRGVGVEEIVA
jgi:Fe2+ transport system protein FeoA